MPEQNAGKLNIIVAVYGLKTVTENITNLIINGKPQILNFTVNNYSIGEDGWRGQKKSITVVYNYDGGNVRVATAKEGDILTITPYLPRQFKPSSETSSTNNGRLSILAATYGPDDVTYKIKNLLSSYNTLLFTAGNAIFGDSWYGVPKTLVIVLGTNDGVSEVQVFAERESCYIDLNDVVSAV